MHKCLGLLFTPRLPTLDITAALAVEASTVNKEVSIRITSRVLKQEAWCLIPF